MSPRQIVFSTSTPAASSDRFGWPAVDRALLQRIHRPKQTSQQIAGTMPIREVQASLHLLQQQGLVDARDVSVALNPRGMVVETQACTVYALTDAGRPGWPTSRRRRRSRRRSDPC
jgi:hypothetical protein